MVGPQAPRQTKRNEAEYAGATQYFTGKTCINGHSAARHTSNGRCTECERINSKDGGKRGPQSRTVKHMIMLGMSWSFHESERLWREALLKGERNVR